MKHKSFAMDCFMQYGQEIANKSGRTMGMLGNDGGGEYCHGLLKPYVAAREQNGKSQPEKRPVVECASKILQAKQLPSCL